MEIFSPKYIGICPKQRWVIFLDYLGLIGFNLSVELCDHCVLTELEAILNKLSVLTRVSVCYIISKMLIKQNYENSIFFSFYSLCSNL